MDERELRARRGASQLLALPAASPVEVVRRLLAVQAQDLGSAYLALRARVELLEADTVRQALADGSLVAGWLLRGTLHLTSAEDYRWLLALTAPACRAGSRRRLSQEGVSSADAERAVETIGRALADEGPLTRSELGERLAARGIRSEGQALPHLLALAALRGIAVLGPLEGTRQAFVLAADRLPRAPEPDRDRSLAELARRYLAGHGPALPSDLARWAGLPVRDSRAGLGSIARELVESDGGLVDLAGREPAESLPPRLLPAFDPYLLGWADRSFAVPAAHARRVHPGGGMIRATATVDGTAVATWRLRGGAVELEPFGELGSEDAAALGAEAADVLRFRAS